MYAAPTFYAQAPARLAAFLTTVPAEKLAWVRRLEIAHETAGVAMYEVQLRGWKEKVHRRWQRAAA